MSSWQEFRTEAPRLADRAEELLNGHVHHVLGTLRADGYPRLSGTEIKLHGGELYWGSMPAARKAQDLLRNPRFSIHCGTADPPLWQADVKITGLARVAEKKERIAAYPESEVEPFTLFRAEVQEVALVSVEDERLLIDLWHHRRGLKQMRGA